MKNRTRISLVAAAGVAITIAGASAALAYNTTHQYTVGVDGTYALLSANGGASGGGVNGNNRIQSQGAGYGMGACHALNGGNPLFADEVQNHATRAVILWTGGSCNGNGYRADSGYDSAIYNQSGGRGITIGSYYFSN